MTTEKNEFEKAGLEDRDSIITEFVYFLRENKKWWLTPIILVLLLVGWLVLMSGGGAAPFIYALF